MNRILPLLCVVFLLAATLGAGLVQGRLTNRWGVRPDARLAANQLAPKLPDEVGNWKVQQDVKFLPQVSRILQNPAYLNRVYVNQQTGDQVQIAVIVGHPGPVSVHTPEICYSAKDYTVSATRRKTSVAVGSASHDFWELPLKPTNPLIGSPLRVFYAWSTGVKWEAATHPRFGYGGLPHLYKLQMSVSAQPGSDLKQFDPAHDFLTSFLQQLQPRMVEASRS